MLPFFIAYCVVGAGCIVMGLLIWKKGKLGLTRGYRPDCVTDKAAYGAANGKAYLWLGVFFIAVGAAALPERISREALNYMTVAGIIAYVFCMAGIQKKYFKMGD